MGWPAGYSQTVRNNNLNLEVVSLLNTVYRRKASGRTVLPNRTAPHSVKSDWLSLTQGPGHLPPGYLPLKSQKIRKRRKGTGPISIDMTGALAGMFGNTIMT